MKPRPPLPPGPFLVGGLARSGEAAALALIARGETVIGCDTGRPDAAGRLRAAGVEVHEGTPGGELVTRARTLVKSPGVPREAPVVAAARGRGLTVIGELELAWRLIPNQFIAVTGTNGKTTTTELIRHVHREAGLPAASAGNVGKALASLVDHVAPEATVVCECSSFQLEDTEAFAPEAAVLLNLGEDHLDRHGDMAAYTAAKLRAFARQEPADVAVAPSDLRGVTGLGGRARRVSFGTRPGDDLTDRDGSLWWGEQRLIAVDEIRLRGLHNRANAMAGAAITLARAVAPEAVAAALRSFPGVAHRLEEVGEHGGVLYVNDSKATNVGSTLVALDSFPAGTVHLILGGRGKGGAYDGLARAVASRARAAYLIGVAAEPIGAALTAAGAAWQHAGDLGTAVAAARGVARPGEVVLLSPACASYDQYPDFEARGAHFRALAEAAAGGT